MIGLNKIPNKAVTITKTDIPLSLCVKIITIDVPKTTIRRKV